MLDNNGPGETSKHHPRCGVALMYFWTRDHLITSPESDMTVRLQAKSQMLYQAELPAHTPWPGLSNA